MDATYTPPTRPVLLPRALHQELKVFAANNDKRIGDAAIEAITQYLKKKEKAAR